MLLTKSDDNPLPPLSRSEGRVALYLTPAFWLISNVLFLIPMLVAGQEPTPFVFLSLGAITLGGTVLSFVLMFLIWHVFERQMRHKLIVVTISVLVAAAALALIDLAAASFLASIQPGNTLSSEPLFRLTNNFAVFIPHFGLLGAFYALLAHNRIARDRDRMLAEANALAQQARLSALRYQLNPHFLFNTLNSISSLVVTRRNKGAEEMLTLLSEFLRVTLISDSQKAQTLESELETIDAYLGIERIRFGDRLAIEVCCPTALRDAVMPPFMLQPLVENAIKYGVAASEKTVTISINARTDADDLVVCVENDGLGRRLPGGKGAGVGLRNVRDRLQSLYGERGRLETVKRDAGYLAVVRLPLLVE